MIARYFLISSIVESIRMPKACFIRLHFSFLEFLAALEERLVIEEIINHSVHEKLVEPVHRKLLDLVAEYLALGGMPEVVDCWKRIRQPLECGRLQTRIFDTYHQDFNKYAKAYQIKYLELLLKEAPRQLGKKFKFSEVGDYRKRELEPALNLLETAGITHKVTYTAAQGIPPGAQAKPDDFKLMLLDVGLTQFILSHDLTQWFLNPLAEFVNKGALVEAFIGQELLAYCDPYIKPNLYYWHSKERSSSAEVDYIIRGKEHLLPVEVKGGSAATLKSMHLFLEAHRSSPYGIRFSSQNYSVFGAIHSYPLYAVAKLSTHSAQMKKAFESLISKTA